MRIDFVYVTITSGKKVAVNPEHLVCIMVTDSGFVDLVLSATAGRLETEMTFEQAVRAFSPMNIAGGR